MGMVTNKVVKAGLAPWIWIGRIAIFIFSLYLVVLVLALGAACIPLRGR